MVLFEMDGGDQREPLLNFKLFGMWGKWRVEMCLFEMDGGDQREPPLVFK